VQSTWAVVSVVGAALVAAACGIDSATAPIGPDSQCVFGTLAVGQTITGDLRATTRCMAPLFLDSAEWTVYESYNFSVQAGKGYLISVLAGWSNYVGLIGGTPGSEVTLGFADYVAPYQSTIPFVASSTTAYLVRVGADNYDVPTDTGAFTLRVQSCKVPVATITDSTTHSDSLTASDCTDPRSDFIGLDSSHVHIYAIHFDSAASRTIYFAVPGTKLAFDLGGPGYDPYGFFETSTWFALSGISGGSSTFTAGDSGTYTMVVGTAAYSPASVPYTMTIGAEVPAALHVTAPPAGTSAAFNSAQGRTFSVRKRGH
jgi:hypothetical protein